MTGTLSTSPNAAIPAGLLNRRKTYDSAAIKGATAHAAGIMFVAPDGDVLMLHRSKKEENFPGHWSLPGGGADEGETPEQAAIREAREEMGVDADPDALRDIEKTITPKGKAFHTYVLPVEEKFVPKLNDEHSGYAWASLDMLPRPMHPAIESMLKTRLGVAEDMSPGDWAGLREGMLKWIREEERDEIKHRAALDSKITVDVDDEDGQLAKLLDYIKKNSEVGHSFGIVVDPDDRELARKFYIDGDGAFRIHEIALDELLATDPPVSEAQRRAMYAAAEGKSKLGISKKVGEEFVGAADSRIKLALDRDTVREKRKDGQLVVKRAHITKANVCPYRGEEIPGWEELGLDRNAIYNLLRDPEELKKAAPSLNGVQLLRKHIPVNAEDHQPYDTVGSLGTDAEFVEDDGENYLDNSLFVNASDAIEGIESGKKRELSAAYHYTPDMTPGNFRGTPHDGVMRNIVFNHVALVEDGRAGPDVVVGDSMENLMAKPTKLGVHVLALTATRIAPLIAMDQKVTLPADLVGLFKGLTTKNISATKAKLLDGVKLALDGKTKPKLALDGPLEHLKAAVDAYEELAGPKADEPAAEEKVQDTIEPIEGEVEGKVFDGGEVAEFLRGKGMGEDDIKTVCDMMPKNGLGNDEDDEQAKKKAAEEKERKKKEGAMDKQAMDAALKAQGESFEKRIKEVQENERGVRAAISTVRDWVGDLPATMAFDSAGAVYRHVLTMKGVADAKTLHNDALLPILKTLPKIGAKTPQGDAPLAMDSTSDAFKLARELAPGLANISAV